METKEPALYKHCESFQITWTVTCFNFSEKLSYCLKSSTFNLITPVPSRWYLGLEWKMNDKNARVLDVCLIRKRDDKLQEKAIRGSVRLGHFNEDGKQHWHPEVLNGFLRVGIVYSISSYIINQKDSDTTITFLCDIIVYNDRELEFKSTKFCKTSARVILQMPLYQKAHPHHKENRNIRFVTKDGIIVMANEKVLSSCCARFDKVLSETVNGCISLSVTTMTLQQLLLYLYCNTLDYHTDTYVSFDLIEIALVFGVPRLVMMLRPRKISLKTEAGGGNCKFTWNISDFNSLEFNKIYQSRTVTLNFRKDLTYCLKIYHNNEAIAIFLQVLNGSPDIESNVKISLRGKSGTDYTRTYSLSFSSNSIVGDAKFISKSEYNMQNFLQDDGKLIIDCLVSHSDMKFINKVEEVIDFENSCFFDPMKKVIEKLEDKNPTLIIRTSEQDFYVHSSILRARSKGISEMLDKLSKNQNQILDLSDISQDIMKLILQYIYSGKLFLENYDKALKVYEISFKLDVDLLRDICVSYLKFNFVQEKVFCILRRADELKDYDLKQFSIQYICRCPAVLFWNEWNDMKHSHRHLHEEVAKALSNSIYGG